MLKTLDKHLGFVHADAILQTLAASWLGMPPTLLSTPGIKPSLELPRKRQPKYCKARKSRTRP
jgi:hypothetical protein